MILLSKIKIHFLEIEIAFGNIDKIKRGRTSSPSL
jgi:hypothetical protein